MALPKVARLSSLQSYQASVKYSDLTIKCGSCEWKVSAAILCSKSKYFEKACSGNFKEATSGIIEFPDDDPVDIERLLIIFYGGEYDDDDDATSKPELLENDKSEDIAASILSHCKVFALGDMYGCKGAQSLACTKVMRIFRSWVSSKAYWLMERDLIAHESIIKALQHVVNFRQSGLWSLLVAAMAVGVLDITSEHGHVKNFLNNHPEVALDVLKKADIADLYHTGTGWCNTFDHGFRVRHSRFEDPHPDECPTCRDDDIIINHHMRQDSSWLHQAFD